MSKQNNLTDFLTGVADAIRAKKGTTALINPQNFESEIASISGGGGELNIAYGDTAPEDTSKLWIKSEEPSNISFPVVWNPEQIVEGIIDTGTTLPQVKFGIGTAAVGTKIYLFGGYNSSSSTLNTIQVFDTTNNTIQTLSATLPQVTSAIGTAAVGTKIYLFGGCNSSSSILNTINLFTVNVPLSSNDIIVAQEYYARTFKILKAPTEVEVSVKYVYKGDQNLAKLIDAYLYDGANWVNVNTGAAAAISRTITATLTNVTAASGNATTIAAGETKVLTYTANSGYTLPDSVTVTGATGVWNKDAGTLTLSNPTANVTFTIAGVEAATKYTITVTSEGGFDMTFTQNGVTLLTGAGTFQAEAGTVNGSTNAFGCNITVSGGVAVDSTSTTSPVFTITGDGAISYNAYCLIEGTQITLADGTTKAIEDITYDDELLVWNFYAGRFDKAKPNWIKVAEVAPRYNLVKFSNGSEVGFVGAGGEKGYHRIFNKEAGAFTYTGNLKETPNGTTTFAQDETFPTVVSQEVINKEVKFYNVITDKHYNLFANGILTSCRLSNKYRIEDMRYIGEKLISDEQEKAYFERIENKRK